MNSILMNFMKDFILRALFCYSFFGLLRIAETRGVIIGRRVGCSRNDVAILANANAKICAMGGIIAVLILTIGHLIFNASLLGLAVISIAVFIPFQRYGEAYCKKQAVLMTVARILILMQAGQLSIIDAREQEENE